MKNKLAYRKDLDKNGKECYYYYSYQQLRYFKVAKKEIENLSDVPWRIPINKHPGNWTDFQLSNALKTYQELYTNETGDEKYSALSLLDMVLEEMQERASNEGSN